MSVARICVFCGSSPGARPDYVTAATRLGRVLADRCITLIYGGATVGLMGAVARTVIANGGDVIGVIPRDMARTAVAFTDLADLRVVDSMHERKAQMVELADGFIALPGGLGTLEEFFEVLTWAQLGLHAKPCGLLNISDYFGPLIAFLERTIEEEFVGEALRSLLLVADSPESLLSQFEAYQPPRIDKAAWALRLSGR
jgi:hypothetical protein